MFVRMADGPELPQYKAGSTFRQTTIDIDYTFWPWAVAATFVHAHCAEDEEGAEKLQQLMTHQANQLTRAIQDLPHPDSMHAAAAQAGIGT